MRRDTALLDAWRPGDPPILRLYRWRPYAVSYGFHQRSGDFDHAAIASRGWDLVQRPTGGRAILHAEELTYSVVGPSPSPLFGPSLHSCYMAINEPLVAFLRALGHEAEISGGEDRREQRQAVCFKSAGQHEIRIGGRKIVGSAQRRREGVFLQHGSILVGPRHADLLDCLPPRRRGGLDRDGLLAVTTDLGRLRGAPYQESEYADLEERLASAFAARLGLELVPVAWTELGLADQSA
ncbi:MAG TPA: octanoyltransferase [Candidatus Krumholzibacteria bacterium]|nr:octanoyltransferase [Candidatus Krumholzibacteria bacterium]HPD71337.1 octanoyltransferase [Candidatus Krumholzibacteria bacterium]HRY38963.1 octanoyltransferase [Candidatus Krumholzibacteria bacterium]